jgi:exodeoxyribonuclease-5
MLILGCLMSVTLSRQQEQAVRLIGNPDEWARPGLYAWLAGFAGSGKSTIIPWIVEEFGARKPLYLAPTNKAARVISKKTGERAISIHKAIYFPPAERGDAELKALVDEIKVTTDPDKLAELRAREADLRKARAKLDRGDELNWQINPEGEARGADLIIVDEASMVGTELGSDLMTFGKPVIAIGDPGQLPPVNERAGWRSPIPSRRCRR